MSQLDREGGERVIGCLGRSLIEAEKNYSISELEALTIFDALKPLKGLFHNEIQATGRIYKW